MMRFGFAPLYLDHVDVRRATEVLEDVMRNQLWDKSRSVERLRYRPERHSADDTKCRLVPALRSAAL